MYASDLWKSKMVLFCDTAAKNEQSKEHKSAGLALMG